MLLPLRVLCLPTNHLLAFHFFHHPSLDITTPPSTSIDFVAASMTC
jgi:hypothetical protein